MSDANPAHRDSDSDHLDGSSGSGHVTGYRPYEEKDHDGDEGPEVSVALESLPSGDEVVERITNYFGRLQQGICKRLANVCQEEMNRLVATCMRVC